MSSKIETIMRSIEGLVSLCDKGHKTVWFYRRNGIPFYDVFISNNGDRVDSNGNPVRCEHEKCDELLMMLQCNMDKLIESGVGQGSLF